MGKIVLVTGGARSGKSAFAEEMCYQYGEKIAYIATAAALDEGMVDRIKKHQERRPSSWTTIEQQQNIHHVFENTPSENVDIYLLDCLTVWTTNVMLGDFSLDWDTLSRDKINLIEAEMLKQINTMINEVRRLNTNIIVVTNEVGLGIVPENRLARIFRDIAGKANELLAKNADEVHFVVSGIPMRIKG